MQTSNAINTVEYEETEADLIDRARNAISNCNWTIGRCAALWTIRHAHGRTDADFAALVGLSDDQVYQRRRVYERFASVRMQFQHLRWSHFYTALNWDDAEEQLTWAQSSGANVKGMVIHKNGQQTVRRTLPVDRRNDDSRDVIESPEPAVPELEAALAEQLTQFTESLSQLSNDQLFALPPKVRNRLRTAVREVYTKLFGEPEAGSRKPEAGSRKPEAGSRKPEAGSILSGATHGK